MKKEKSFLSVIEESNTSFEFKMKDENGKEFDVGIPLDWFYSRNMNKEDFYNAIESLIMESAINKGRKEGKSSEEAKRDYEFMSKKRHAIPQVRAKRDDNNEFYLEITGRDGKTKICVHYDDTYLSGVKGYLIRESKFVEAVRKEVDRRRVSELVASMAGKRSLGDGDMAKFYELVKCMIEGETSIKKGLGEMSTNATEYSSYIRQEQLSQNVSEIRCDVAKQSNDSPRTPRGDKTPQFRVNDVIDSQERYAFLDSLNPEYIIRVNPELQENSKKIYEYQAFVYDFADKKDEDERIIIIEPENGMHYTKIVYLNREYIDRLRTEIEKEQVIRDRQENITMQSIYERAVADVLAKTISEAANDKNIQQTNHTNMQTFKANCKFFLTGDRSYFTNSLRYVRDKQRIEMMGRE